MSAQREPQTAPAWGDLVAPALTTLVGVHALRSFFSMVVWNIGEDRSATELGLIALGFWAIGLLAWPMTRWLGGTRPEVRFSLVFGAVYVADHFASHPVLTPALGVAAAIVWLWLFPAVVVALGRRGTANVLLPGMLLGLIGQVALQAARHGLDLPVLHGVGPGLEALALAAVLYVGTLRLTPPANEEPAYPSWGLAALGPYLALQFTLLVNLGRVQVLAGWDLVEAAAFVLFALVAAAAAAAWLPPPAARALAAVVGIALLTDPAWLAGAGIWLLAVVQVALAVAVGGIPTPAGGRPARVFGWTIAAAVAFFVLIFLFYSRYEWPRLWVAMAALAAVPVLTRRPGRPVPRAALRAAAAGALIGVLGLAITVAGDLQAGGQGSALEKTGPAPTELTVVTYNIHEAFNYGGLPDPEAVAREIESFRADLIGLQEVGRGWDVTGGPDLLAWLRRRFPAYRFVYAPMLGELIGHVIMSRYPITESGWQHYPRRASRLSYGLTWALLPTGAGDLLFVTTHFSPYEPYASDRVGQATDLLAFWNRRPRTIVAGDLNARPEEAAIRRLHAGGLIDLTAPHGLGALFTYASGRLYERIDYLLASPDVESRSASIPRTLASDHLPVVARVTLR